MPVTPQRMTAMAEGSGAWCWQRSHQKQLGRPRVDPALEKGIQAQLRTGKGMLKVARECPALLFWWQQGLWR